MPQPCALVGHQRRWQRPPAAEAPAAHGEPSDRSDYKLRICNAYKQCKFKQRCTSGDMEQHSSRCPYALHECLECNTVMCHWLFREHDCYKGPIRSIPLSTTHPDTNCLANWMWDLNDTHGKTEFRWQLIPSQNFDELPRSTKWMTPGGQQKAPSRFGYAAVYWYQAAREPSDPSSG